MTNDLTTTYDPSGVEERWLQFWSDGGYFSGPTGAAGEPFCVVIPPPNVTGALHMGHALNNTLQDVLVRRARMQGRPTLWIPGTDHAAIATQNVLERRIIAEEGKTRHDLGREEFDRRFWAWKQEYEARILGQLRRLGCSCDWDRTRFTMDPGLSAAVRTVFVRLYDEGRIYRGNRIINWCPRCTSALSDIEVRYAEVPGELITIRYPLADGSGYISVATTRVETMLGDTGIAVHPDDERYRAVVGTEAVLPLVGRRIRIVADAAVDPAFGTGAVKVTPAHDPNDFEIAERQGLEALNIFDATARTNEHAGGFAGLDRYEAREQVRDRLRSEGFIEREERPYLHSVGHCDRCGTEVEPWLSEQWFVSMAGLAAPAIDAVKEGRVRILPARPFEKMYLDWMTGIRDWCISRQIWLGHRIPVWYCPDGHMTVTLDDPRSCGTCGSGTLEQDPDTLDTWFSSQLWPFSTLGWPEQTEDLEYWYPTTVLVTAYEIMYLWVARMIVSGLHFMGEVPFREVLIHGIVRDFEGKKMSKSLGNTIDPLDIVERYGTDALRFSLARAAIPGQDTNVAEEWIEGDRRFCNKLWNASRFVLQNLGPDYTPEEVPEGLGLPERWIMSRLAQTQIAVDAALDAYELAEAARNLHQFVWSELCDWYVEMAKLALRSEDAAATRAVLHHVLEQSLRLLHPMMPFITEEIWQRLPRRAGDGKSLMVTPWPSAWASAIDVQAEHDMVFLQSVVVEVRRFRHEHNIAPGRLLRAVIAAPSAILEIVDRHADAVRTLARLEDLTTADDAPGDGWSRVVAGPAEVYLPLEGVVDVQAEVQRLEKAIAQTQRLADGAHRKLDNPGFTGKAPADVVAKVRSQLEEHEAKIAKLQAQLDDLR